MERTGGGLDFLVSEKVIVKSEKWSEKGDFHENKTGDTEGCLPFCFYTTQFMFFKKGCDCMVI